MKQNAPKVSRPARNGCGADGDTLKHLANAHGRGSA
jgi:hypothetical protein